MESTQNKTRCPHSKKCGGCQLQNLDYKEQLAHKERTCIRLLGKFCRVEPIIGMENPYHYRNKVQAAFGTTRAGRIISGIYQSSTHNIVAVDSCMTEDEIADRIIVDIRRLLRDFKMTTYNEVTGRGFLRHVLVKRGFQTGEVMVVLVTGTPIFPARNNFTRALLKLHPEITTIIQNVNDRYTSMLLGQNEKTLYGPGYITDILCGLRFRISAKSFYQINPVQTEVLYGKAMEFAEHPEGENLLLYGGAGRGKTFLCNCIAKEVLEHGKTVLYLTAGQLFKQLEDMRFRNKEEEEPFDWDSEILDADLLIIDDLGTEFATMFTASELFRIVNDRKLRKRPVVISTNLDYRALMEQYSDRVMSRLIGEYTTLKFFGDDIRMKKKYR